MVNASFGGMRVLALESRRAGEIAKLIRNYGGAPTVAPAMREIPLKSNQEALEFAGALLRGDVDVVIFLTGVGIRSLLSVIETRYQRENFLAALRKVKVASRGPKPSAVLKELQVPITVTAPEPCTWRELVSALDNGLGEDLGGLRIAIQEYGAPSTELMEALTERGSQILRVPVYNWALPEDLGPLRDAVSAIVERRMDVVIFLTAVQMVHLSQVASEMGQLDALREALQDTVVLSIGPSTSEELRRQGVTPDFEPSHPKMGFLVNEAAQCAAKLLAGKRSPAVAAKKSSHTLSQEKDSSRLHKETSDIEMLHEIGSRMAAADPFHIVLDQIVEFVSALVQCDSCFIYVVDQDRLVLRASKNPHADVIDHLGLRMGQGITGWVAENRKPVAISANALKDPRFEMFKDLPEDLFEAFLSVPIMCRGKLVGVINLQHRQPYQHTPREVRLISTIGFLVGAEIEMARLETEKVQLSDQLESRKHVERAKGILQRELGMAEDEAYKTMQRESRQRRKSMRDIAEAIILSEELRRSQPAQKQ